MGVLGCPVGNVTWLRGRVGVAMITSLSSVIRTARHTRNRVRSTVWRSLHGAAISSCAATRGSRSSRPSAATSWTPTGGQRLRAGWALGILGVIIIICQKPGLPPAPAGMRPVKCTRCNAVQNVPLGQIQFECWQCKTVIPLLLPSGTPRATAPPPPKPRGGGRADSARGTKGPQRHVPRPSCASSVSTGKKYP